MKRSLNSAPMPGCADARLTEPARNRRSAWAPYPAGLSKSGNRVQQHLVDPRIDPLVRSPKATNGRNEAHRFYLFTPSDYGANRSIRQVLSGLRW